MLLSQSVSTRLYQLQLHFTFCHARSPTPRRSYYDVATPLRDVTARVAAGVLTDRDAGAEIKGADSRRPAGGHGGLTCAERSENSTRLRWSATVMQEVNNCWVILPRRDKGFRRAKRKCGDAKWVYFSCKVINSFSFLC